MKFIGETKITLKRDASGIYLLRQGKYCNNLATMVIPFFIVQNHQELKQFWKLSYHISLKNLLPRYQWRRNLRSTQKYLFQTCSNYISLRCSLCANQFLIKHYGFKMQGKGYIASDTKCYNVMTYASYMSYYISFFTKRPWSENHTEKKYFTFSLALW